MKGRLIAHGSHDPVAPGLVTLSLIDAKTQQDLIAAVGSRPSAPADANGHFAFHALAPGFYRVNAVAEGLGRARPIFIRIPYAGELVIEIGEQGTIDGQVVDASGRGVADATIRADTSGDSFAATSTASGTFSLSAEAGSYRVFATTSSLASRAIQPVIVRAGQTTSGLKLVLEASGHISGTVVDAHTKAPIANAAIAIRSAENALAVSNQTTDAAGHFDSGPLSPSKYDLSAAGKLHATVQRKGLSIGASGELSLRLELPGLVSVAGRVMDKAGHGVAGAAVSLRREEETLGAATTDAAGEYQIPNASPGKADALAARAGSIAGAWKSIAIPGDGLEHLDFTLEDEGNLRGHIFAAGRSVPSKLAVVRIRSVFNGVNGPETLLPAAADGAYQGSIAAGSIQISAAYLDGSGESGRSATSVFPDQLTEKDLFINSEDRPSTAGHVHLESGAPVAFADVQIFDSRGNPIARTQSDEQGAFTAYAPVDTTLGMEFVATLADMTGTATRPAGAGSVDITVHAGTVLRGHVVGDPDRPVVGFSLDLHYLPTTAVPIPDALQHLEFPGNDFEIDGAPRTAFGISATSGDRTGKVSVDLTTSVPGDVEIVLNASGTVRGIALDKDTRAPVSNLFLAVDGVAATGDAPVTTQDGSFSISGLSLGAHQLALRNAVYLQQQQIELDGTDLDLGTIYVAKKKIEPGTIGAWFIQGTDGVYLNFMIPGGPADQAGLRIGDAAIAIDGAPVINAADAMARCKGPPGSELVIEVSRGGGRLDFTVARAPAEGQRAPHVQKTQLAAR